MCWKGKNTLQIAQEDIKVFKVVTRDGLSYKSIYKDFPYCLGKTYKQEIEVHDGVMEATIEKGLHSYSLKNTYIATYTNSFLIEVMNICTKEDDGPFYDLHCLDWFYFESFLHGLFRLNCTIPKGSTYYEDDRGEIVSNKLRVDSAEEIKKV